MDNYYLPLTEDQHSADAFLQVWEDSHISINRHLYRGEGYQHPHLVVGDVITGATRAFWIDSLSAYYPGLLALDGKLDEAIQIHLLTTAIWTRFSGLPERWNVATGEIDGGLSWYGGRPEFIESTYYIYRATQDPWYLHVGEMVLRDIKRRCWTKCGWAGLRDVQTGEMIDRMESFFLGETAKYMFLLFTPEHPLNKMDAPWVFSTEGHPLIIPKKSSPPRQRRRRETPSFQHTAENTCDVIPNPLFGVSSTASRSDIFHAASLARLHLRPRRGSGEGPILAESPDHHSVSMSDLSSPTNYTFYPWTLPPQLVPYNATSAPMALLPTLDISFPSLPGGINLGAGSLERIRDGILVKTIGGLRLSMVQDAPLGIRPPADKGKNEDGFRVQVINNVPLGKDEKVFLSRQITFDVVDPYDPNFTRVRDTAMLDLVIDVLPESPRRNNGSADPRSEQPPKKSSPDQEDPESPPSNHKRVAPVHDSAAADSPMKTMLSSLVNSVSSLLRDDSHEATPPPLRLSLPASIPTGLGAAPLPEVEDALSVSVLGSTLKRLSWSTIYFADELCDDRILRDVAQTHEVLVLKRGGCTFSHKLRNIAAYRPHRSSLKLVIVVSYDDEMHASTPPPPSADQNDSEDSDPSPRHPEMPLAAQRAESSLIRPHLESSQTTASGIPRNHLIPMIMVGGGEETYNFLRAANGVGIRRRYTVRSQGVPVTNLYII